LVSVPGQGDRQRHYPEAREDSQRLRKGFLGETDWPKLITAAGRLSDAPIWIAALSPFFTDKIWRRTYC
jgi:replicative DNA helicase